jgi:hypothetical protein
MTVLREMAQGHAQRLPPNNRWRGPERLVVTRRGRGKTVFARGAYRALLGGPSTSPLDSMLGFLLPLSQAVAMRFSWLSSHDS